VNGQPPRHGLGGAPRLAPLGSPIMKHLRLSLPFAYVACALLVLPHGVLSVPWILGAALAGRLLSRALPEITANSLCACTTGAGLLVGAVLSPMTTWMMIPAGGGLGVSATFVLAPVAFAAERVRGRPGSLLESAGVRATWITAALISLTFVAWGRLVGLPLVHTEASLLLSGAIVLGCAAIDLWRLGRLERWRGDLGVGDAVVTLASQGSPYRQEPRVISIVRGDLAETRKILRRQSAFDVAALLFSLAGITGALTT
jgi:hypothetical protein